MNRTILVLLALLLFSSCNQDRPTTLKVSDEIESLDATTHLDQQLAPQDSER